MFECKLHLAVVQTAAMRRSLLKNGKSRTTAGHANCLKVPPAAAGNHLISQPGFLMKTLVLAAACVALLGAAGIASAQPTGPGTGPSGASGAGTMSDSNKPGQKGMSDSSKSSGAMNRSSAPSSAGGSMATPGASHSTGSSGMTKPGTTPGMSGSSNQGTSTGAGGSSMERGKEMGKPMGNSGSSMSK